jgi:hypothetical protein
MTGAFKALATLVVLATIAVATVDGTNVDRPRSNAPPLPVLEQQQVDADFGDHHQASDRPLGGGMFGPLVQE